MPELLWLLDHRSEELSGRDGGALRKKQPQYASLLVLLAWRG
jgi:hypothetical protein